MTDYNNGESREIAVVSSEQSLCSVSVLFVEDTSVVISGQNDLLEFEVHDDHSERGKWYGKWAGVTRPKLSWGTELIRIDEPRGPFPAIAVNPH